MTQAHLNWWIKVFSQWPVMFYDLTFNKWNGIQVRILKSFDMRLVLSFYALFLWFDKRSLACKTDEVGRFLKIFWDKKEFCYWRPKKKKQLLIHCSLLLHFAKCHLLLPAKSTLNLVLLASLEVPLLVFSSFSFSTLLTPLPRDLWAINLE